MADYRKRLSDMTPEERAEVAPAADNFENLFGDRSETPTSVKAADVAVGLTPVGSAVEIGEELSKEDPSYAKIGVIAAGDVLGAAIPAAGPVAKSLIKQSDKIPTKMLSNVEYDARVAELDEAVTADEWKTKAKALVEEGRVVDPQVRTPELEQSARDLIDNKITREEHLQKIDEFKPVDAWDDLPREPSDKATVFALNNKQQTDGNFVLSNAEELGVKKANLKIGDRFLGRLDIPAYKDFDTWIITGTTPKGDRGSTYAKAIHYEARDGKPVILRAAQAKGEEIGKGETGKIGYAVVDGNVKDLDVDAIRAKAAEYLNDPEWTQVGFDPRRQAGFYVRAGENKHVPVREATEVIQIGPLVLAKNAKLDFDHKGYSEGGMALEEQMSMNFGDVPDNTIGQDPVSGNDIPLGSTAENVRDDIPANLSEGEIVVPADVVNFHGVKLFEDLRAEAKMGYAQMAEDGRIGGEPMDMNEDMDIELSELDLEIMDDEAPVEMRRGGMSMKDYETPAAKKAFAQAAKRNPSRKNQKTHEEIMAQFRDDDSSSSSSSSKPSDYYSAENISKRVQARKNKPKTRGEALYRSVKDLFSGGDDDDKPTRNKYNLDLQFGGNLAERGARKFGTAAPSAGQVQGAYTGQQQQPFNTDFEKQPFFQALVQNLKKELGMDEGGLVSDEDQHLIGGESQFNQGPYYAPDQKGGFDMENAYANYGQGEGPVIEMREYMNDEGHRIFITFIDGEPQMEIPAGYYPVGDDVVVAPQVPPVGGSGGSDMGDSGSGTDIPTPQAVNFKELSMEELTQLIEDQKSLGSKIVKNINPLVRIAMWDQTRRTKAEIERRLVDPNTSNVDRMRLQQLLEIANRDEPGLIKTLLDKVTGNTLQTAAGQIPKPKIPDVDFNDPTEAGTVAAAYTPNDQEEDGVTTPGVDEAEYPSTFSPEIQQQIKDASATAAVKAFGTPKQKAARQRVENALAESNERVGQDNNPNRNDDDGPTYTPAPPAPSYTRPANDPYAEPGRPTTRRTGGGGRNKGGLAKKKKSK